MIGGSRFSRIARDATEDITRGGASMIVFHRLRPGNGRIGQLELVPDPRLLGFNRD